MKYVITGLKEFTEGVKKRAGFASSAGAVKAVRAGGKVIEAAMVSNAPVLESTTPGSSALPPGTLRASVKTTVSLKTGEAVATIGPRGKAEFIGALVEYGHRSIKGGKNQLMKNGKVRGPGRDVGKDVPAHPWARPAFEASAEEAVGTMAAVALAGWEEGI